MPENNQQFNNGNKQEHFVCEEKEEGKLVCQKEETGESEVVEANAKPAPLGRGNIFIGTLNLMAAPAKAVAEPLKKHYTKKYHGKYTHAKKLFVVDLILLGIVGFLAFINIYLALGGKFDFFVLTDRALLDVSYSKEKIVSGEEITFYINYLNNSDDILEETSLTVDLPNHFVLNSYRPESFDAHNHILTIGNLPAGANGKLEISGRLYGSIEEPQNLTGVFSYNVGNRQGNQLFTAAYFIEDSNIRAIVNLPNEAVKNQLFNFTVDYYNDSSQKIDKILIVPEWQADFRLSRANISFDSALGGFIINNLEAGETGRLEIEGALFTNKEKEDLSLKTYLILDKDKLLQKRELGSVGIVDTKTSFVVSWPESEDNIGLGETVNYKLKYGNNGDYSIRNVLLKAVIESEPLGIKEENFIFDFNSHPELALLRPGSAGEINFIYQIQKQLSWNEVIEGEPVVKSYIIAEYILEDETDRRVREQSPAREQKINTNLSVDAFARYFSGSGDQLGRGPLPPEVGAPTKYWIFWHPTNNLSDAEDVLITAVLPENVELTGLSLPMDLISFDPATRQISWQVGRVNKYSGTPGKGVSFEVSLIPDETQVGGFANLIENIILKGKDIFTGEVISRNLGFITTDLIRDQKVKDDGRVVR